MNQPTTRYEGGPLHGTRLGRARPQQASGGAGLPTDSGPDVIPVIAFQGEYRRASEDGALEDRYVWHPDVLALAPASVGGDAP